MNTDRGWSNNRLTLLTHRAVTHVSDGQVQGGLIPSVEQVAKMLESAPGDVVAVFSRLANAGLATTDESSVLEEGAAHLTAPGMALAQEWRAAQDSPRPRRVACRDALLDWLDGQGRLSSVDEFAGDVRAHYFGSPFSEAEIREAGRFLHGEELIDGMNLNGRIALPRIMDEGRKCVERYDSNIAAWQERGGSVGGISINVTGSQGVTIASNSPDAKQAVSITTDTRAQVVNLADALEQTLPSLGLDAQGQVKVVQAIRDLRAQGAAVAEDVGRLRRILDTVKEVAVSGTGAAAGTGIVALGDALVRTISG